MSINVNGPREYMELAVREARRCRQEERHRGTSPSVGAVVVKDGELFASGFRGEFEDGPGDHAEFVALERKLAEVSLMGAHVFTTLERVRPASVRLQ